MYFLNTWNKLIDVYYVFQYFQFSFYQLANLDSLFRSTHWDFNEISTNEIISDSRTALKCHYSSHRLQTIDKDGYIFFVRFKPINISIISSFNQSLVYGNPKKWLRLPSQLTRAQADIFKKQSRPNLYSVSQNRKSENRQQKSANHILDAVTNECWMHV